MPPQIIFTHLLFQVMLGIDVQPPEVQGAVDGGQFLVVFELTPSDLGGGCFNLRADIVEEIDVLENTVLGNTLRQFHLLRIERDVVGGLVVVVRVYQTLNTLVQTYSDP